MPLVCSSLSSERIQIKGVTTKIILFLFKFCTGALKQGTPGKARFSKSSVSAVYGLSVALFFRNGIIKI